MKRVLKANVFSLMVIVVILSGCQLTAPGSETIYETTSAEMAILLRGIVSPMGLSAGSATDVVSMSVEVAGEDIYGAYQDPLATVDLTLDGDGVWRGTIPGLPIGPALTFTVIAYDAADDEIYSGVTVQALTGAGDEVSVTLEPVEDVAAITFPIITRIARAEEMVNGSLGNSVSVDVRGSAVEQMSYAFTGGGGSFTPEAGTVVLPSSGTGTFVSGYDAPAVIGEYVHNVRVENSQGNAVTTSFTTLVVYGTTSVGMETSFAPSVVGLSGQRIGNVVIWEADVTDDGPATELVYLWEYDGTLAFVDATQNPAELPGYEETQEGTITLTVTDGDLLSTVVSFILVAGQFPDALVDNTASFNTGPAGGIVFYDKGGFSDGWRYLEAAPSFQNTRSSWGGYTTWVGGTSTAIGTGEANTNAIVALYGNAEPRAGRTDYAAKLCYDLVIGGYDDWFLPSKDELNLMYQHREAIGGFSSGDYLSSSETSSWDVWSHSFSNGSQTPFLTKDLRVWVRAIRAF